MQITVNIHIPETRLNNELGLSRMSLEDFKEDIGDKVNALADDILLGSSADIEITD